MKRCKINFFTSLDGNIWLNKNHLEVLIRELKENHRYKKDFIRELLKEINKCHSLPNK